MRTLSFLILNLLVIAVYGIDIPSKPIQYYIDNKIPFYLTGNSTQPQMGNALSVYFLNLRHDSYINPSTVSYSSVSILVDNEFRMAPLGFKASIYPIKLLNDNIVVCTLSPKLGYSYTNIYEQNEGDLVYLDFNSAVSNEEISESPIELSIQNLKKYFGLVSNEYNINQGLNLKCILNDLLKNYTWIDEFQKDDFYQSANQKFYPIFSKLGSSTYSSTSITTDNNYFVDYEATFGQYDFQTGSFPITLKRMTEYSSSFSNFPFDVIIKASDQTLQLSKKDFSPTDYNLQEKKWSNFVQNNRNQYGYYSSSISFNFFINKQAARDLSTSFNSDRTAIVRLQLEPVKKYNNLNSIGCDNISNLKIGFNLKDIKISPSSGKETTSNLGIHEPNLKLNILNSTVEVNQKELSKQYYGVSDKNEPEFYKPDEVEVMPCYPGGTAQLLKFLKMNTRYPPKAKDNGLEGKVIVKFYIDIDGAVKDPIVLEDGVGGGCAEELIRVVKAMPKWTPGTKGGKPVKVYYTLPQTFKLN